MGTHALALLPARDAVHPDDVVGLERWAAAQHVQLRLLQRELAAAHAAARAAAEALSRLAGERAAEGPDLGPQLESVVLQQAARLDAELEAVRAAAALLISDAVCEATDLLLAAGVDATTIKRITRPGDAPADLAPEAPVVSADQHLPLEPLGGGAEDREAGHAASGEPDAPPVEGLNESRLVDLDGSASNVLDLTQTRPHLAGSDVQAFDLFWGGFLDDRPVRDRLRRWAQRQEQ